MLLREHDERGGGLDPHHARGIGERGDQARRHRMRAVVRAALQRCEFVVLQEAQQDTSTARYADLLLPATTWGEKSGTVTNSCLLYTSPSPRD